MPGQFAPASPSCEFLQGGREREVDGADSLEELGAIACGPNGPPDSSRNAYRAEDTHTAAVSPRIQVEVIGAEVFAAANRKSPHSPWLREA